MKDSWQTKKLGEVLLYEQPTKYIVKSTKYNDDYEAPVLTAGKSFILGKTAEKSGIFPNSKLPVIIFDDFTTATKFVDFCFKVKSSAMKILHPVKNMSDAKFLFYIIQNINFDHTGIHKRYWISEYSKIEILLPSLPEQRRIVKILDDVFEKMAKAKENAEKNLQNSKELFESYLHNIFANPGKDWEERKLKEVCDKLFAGGDVPKNNLSKIKTEKYNIPIFANGFKNKGLYGYTDIIKVTKPSITISARGTIGYAEIRKEAFFPVVRLIVLTPDVKIIDLFFLYYMAHNFNFSNTGTSIPQLTIPMIENIKIPIPSIQEQKSIVKKIDTISDETKKLEKIYKQKLADLEELKKSVLKSAFAGKY